MCNVGEEDAPMRSYLHIIHNYCYLFRWANRIADQMCETALDTWNIERTLNTEQLILLFWYSPHLLLLFCLLCRPQIPQSQLVPLS